MTTTPILTDPDKYQIELFADFSTLDPPLDAFQMTVTNGENGFDAGMYVTSGPASGTLGNRLVRVDRDRSVTVVKEGIQNAETLIFAQGDYGDGILICEPFDRRIRRLLPDGTLTTFAENASTPPFGPSTFAYGPDGFLYATDGAFDTEGVLGGGMFVTEGTNFKGPGKVWRITSNFSIASFSLKKT
jgi:hypothetical protein